MCVFTDCAVLLERSAVTPPQVKVWNLQSGFCFATFTDHAAPVTAVQFLGSGHAVVRTNLRLLHYCCIIIACKTWLKSNTHLYILGLSVVLPVLIVSVNTGP